MIRHSPRPIRALSLAVTAGAVLATAACSNESDETPAASSRTVGILTQDEARTALINGTVLEGNWTRVNDTAGWRDSLLIGKVDASQFSTNSKADAADCQKLLDVLYSDELLTKPSGANAMAGFTGGRDGARLLYTVASHDQEKLNSSLAWLKTLPVKCAQFAVKDRDGSTRTAQVIETSLPKAGDARQGLRLTLQGPVSGTPGTLTLDLAAVRVGSNAITVTNGGLGGTEVDSTQQAVTLGTQRLKDALAGRSPAQQPPGQQD
ncbi:hypothetical protein ABT275_40835 [Streptomyces sp. NPDC001185]|uniref:hypothetical protein n=1 Tax=Streptomyces sp. NPDC001185 TaxID=3154380 RepID=UPI00331B3622